MKKLVLQVLLACFIFLSSSFAETITYIDGSIYTGELKDGVLHGQGTYIFPDGEQYIGEWNDGEFVN